MQYKKINVNSYTQLLIVLESHTLVLTLKSFVQLSVKILMLQNLSNNKINEIASGMLIS